MEHWYLKQSALCRTSGGFKWSTILRCSIQSTSIGFEGQQYLNESVVDKGNSMERHFCKLILPNWDSVDMNLGIHKMELMALAVMEDRLVLEKLPYFEGNPVDSSSNSLGLCCYYC